MRTVLTVLTTAIFLCLLVLPVRADSTFTYQGQLTQANQAVSAQVDFEFRLFDQVTGGDQVGPVEQFNDWPIVNGLFQVDLDFGEAAFGPDNRYLEIRVNNTTLTPRQPVRPAPLALFALSGNEGPQGPPGADGADGAENAWGLQGSEGTDPASGYFLGTSDNVPFHLGVNSQRVLRVEPVANSNISPNWIAGHKNNHVGAEIVAATISGGGNSVALNEVLADYGTIGGGRGHSVSGTAATVVGGQSNVASGLRSTVLGGQDNTASGNHSVVSGGQSNCAGPQWSWAGGRHAKIRPGEFTVGDPGIGCADVEHAGPGGHTGTFLWSDASLDDTFSGQSNQFLVRASNGVILTGGADPVNVALGNRLRVDGTMRLDELAGATTTTVAVCRNANNQISNCSSEAASALVSQALEQESSELRRELDQLRAQVEALHSAFQEIEQKLRSVN